MSAIANAIWDAWKAYSRRAGSYQATLLLWLAYAIALGLTVLLSVAARSPLLSLRPRAGTSCWIGREPAPRDLPSLERQF